MNIKERRTIRKYTQQPIQDELLNRLLEDAARTQTMGNLQLYSVVVTKSSEMKKRLAPAHFNQPMITEAPVVLTVCADFRRTTNWCEFRNAVPGYNNLLSFMNAAKIIEILDLPRLVFPVATLTVGWPDENPNLTDRLPMGSFVHNETYHSYTEQSINDFYANKESLEENKHFVEINNKETLAQVFTDIRYTKKDNEHMSQGFLNALLHQDFIKPDSAPILSVVETRPEILECDVVRFQNKKEKWVAFVGLLDNLPYEIFTGLMDEEEGIALPKSVTSGRIIKHIDRDGQKRYDFQFINKRGYKTTIEGLSEKFNPEYWDYAKLISGVLRYRMPIDHVIRLVTSLQLESDSINSWKVGVARVLRKYLPESQQEELLEEE